ncbi:unnamed protein product [Cyprideis torosa]|uniref:Uncharacterized protein n=1 Tax=Cyprideis torosa TaxID=163714 RepID=A0A7R8WS73_9CRUS|nr:unnamed protein product [Cyprideis torosa]CAG0904859.1 unnamed protein product [Cyprideis torosa]
MMDCMNVNEATKMASQVWKELCHVPFMAKFVVFAKRHAEEEARLRVFCMTDVCENKTLETQEHFTEIAKSKDVEVLEGKPQFLEFGGNLVPVTKSGDQLRLMFEAFRENRLPFTVRIKDINSKPVGRIAFMRDPRAARGEPPQTPVCNLTIEIPEGICPDRSPSESDLLSTTSSKHRFRQTTTYGEGDSGIRQEFSRNASSLQQLAPSSTARPDAIHKAELQVADLCQMVGSDWVRLGQRLGLTPQETDDIRLECGSDDVQAFRPPVRRTGRGPVWYSSPVDINMATP